MVRRTTRFKRTSRRARGYARQKLTNYGRARRGLAPLAPRGFASVSAANKEKKVFDCGDYLENISQGTIGEYLVSDIDVNGLVTPMFIPELGSDYNQRIGRKCIIKSMYLKLFAQPFFFSAPSNNAFLNSTSVPQTEFRVLVVYDTNPNGILPTVSDILQPVGAGAPATLSFINMNNRDRFRIILDKFVQFAGFSNLRFADYNAEIQYYHNSLGNTTKFNLKKYKKMNSEVIFNSTSNGTIGDISSGALYLVQLSSETDASNHYAVSEANWRIRYDDS